MMNIRICWYTIFFLHFYFCNYAIADELYLKNGDRITGQVIELLTTHCTFETNYQAVLQIERDDILRLNITQSIDSTSTFDSKQLSEIRAKGTGDNQEQNRTQEILGEQPDEDLRQIFLRQSTVLLKPNEKELDISFSYTRNELANLRTRQFNLPLSLRMGLTERLESFIEIPISWAENEIFSQQSVNKNDNFGIGDVSAGVKYLLKQQNEQWTDIIGSLSVIAPTGEKPSYLNPDSVSTGSGHWHISTGLTLVKSYDPAVLFGSIGYSHSFKETFHGVEVEPNDSFNYSFGMGFAINNKITISGLFSGSYQTEIEYDGIKEEGSSSEPLSLRTGLTYRIAKGRYLEPAVIFGMTNDSPDAILTLSYTHKLDF